MRAALISILGVMMSMSGAATPQAADAPANVIAEMTPTGKLRAAINLGNVVLAQKSKDTGALGGVSVDIAKELARRLGKPIEFIEYDAAGKVTDAVKDQVWDVCFLGADPVRGAGIAFTAPYVLIEGGYMVPAGSPIQKIEDVDREGVRIAVGRGAAYDLYLTRTIKKATLVRAPTSAAAIDMGLQDKLEVIAGVKVPLVRFAAGRSDVRVLDGRFMAIEQAVGTHKAREASARYLAQMVEEMKASGFIANGLAASRQTDAIVAPPAK